MVRILLADLYGAHPEYHRAVPDLPRMLATRGRRAPHRRPGADGERRTGSTSSTSPRGGTGSRGSRSSRRSGRSGGTSPRSRSSGRATTRGTGSPRSSTPPWRGRGSTASSCAEYFETNLHYDLDEDDERGLAEFYRRAAAHGLIPSPDLPPFAGVPLVPRSFS